MSRVTIKDIHDDMVYSANWSQIRDTEIVPRKIVEKIIAECDKTINEYEGCEVCTFEYGVRDMAQTIKEIAESLLSKFEEDDQ